MRHTAMVMLILLSPALPSYSRVVEAQTVGEQVLTVDHEIPCQGIKNVPIIDEDCTCKMVMNFVADRAQLAGDEYIVVVDAFAMWNERKGVETARGLWARDYLANDKGLGHANVQLRTKRLKKGEEDSDRALIFFLLVPRDASIPQMGTPVTRLEQLRRSAASN